MLIEIYDWYCGEDMAACMCCHCGGCGGCAAGASFCGCGVHAAMPMAYGYLGRTNNVSYDRDLDEKTKQEVVRVLKEAENFNNSDVIYKNWSIKITVDQKYYEVNYLAKKEGESKEFSNTNLANLEQRIDSFESEGTLRKDLDRIL